MYASITRYKPNIPDMETRLRPFIPDFIPAVGDIDAMIKVSLLLIFFATFFFIALYIRPYSPELYAMTIVFVVYKLNEVIFNYQYTLSFTFTDM